MITSVAGPPEPMAVSQAIQSDVAPRAPVRSQTVQAPVTEAKPAEVKAVEVAPKSAATVVQEAAKEAASQESSAKSPANINVRFRIDQNTQDVTIFLLDQQTREVIRTIPPNEMAKLTPGDLVNLFA